ncbi:MAG: aminotransferase class IV [Acidobacteriota bacterium]
MSERINVNGAITPPERASISPLDRGFLYGDAVYETILARGGRPFRLREHLDRLRRSADRLAIPHRSAPVDVEREVLRTLEASGIGPAAVRVVLSRGVGPLGYDPAPCGPPTVVVQVRELPPTPREWLREGIDVAVVSVERNPVGALDPAIKSCNLLNNLLAWMEARALGACEPILLNRDGRVAEGASSNVFIAREGRLLTPSSEDGILRGITRDIVLDLARRDGLEAAEAGLLPDDLRRADEAFITSTLKGILPVRRCDGWPVHHGRPGPLTLRLMERYEALVQEETKAGSRPGSIRR